MRVGSGTASVLFVDGVSDIETYRITTEELARLLAGEPPADDAPDGFGSTTSPLRRDGAERGGDGRRPDLASPDVDPPDATVGNIAGLTGVSPGCGARRTTG